MSRIRDFKSLSGNREHNKMQDNVTNALTPFIRNPLLGGLLLKNIELSSGANLINHQLGRALQGWVVVRKRANINIWDDQDNNVNVSTTLKLQASGSVVVDLYVF